MREGWGETTCKDTKTTRTRVLNIDGLLKVQVPGKVWVIESGGETSETVTTRGRRCSLRSEERKRERVAGRGRMLVEWCGIRGIG